MTTLTAPSSIITEAMTNLLASLAGTSIFMRNTNGGLVILSSDALILSSSPGYMHQNGTLVISGSSVGHSYAGNTGTMNGGSLAFVTSSGFEIGSIPIVTGPVAMVTIVPSEDKMYFHGAIIGPPIGDQIPQSLS